MNSRMMMYISGTLIVVLSVIYIYSMRKKPKGVKAVNAHATGMGTKGVYLLYRFFSATPVLKRYYKKLRTRIEVTYPADEVSVRRKTTISMARSFLICLLLILFAVLASGGDVYFICMGTAVAWLMFTSLISGTQKKYDTRLLIQLGDFITNVRHHYSLQGAVEDAIYDTLDETPYEMGLHATKIHKILTSTNMSVEVDKYTDIAPNKFMLTFVATCATIREYGDKRMDDGQSLFLKNINYIKEEINTELVKRRHIDFLFSGLTALSLLPLLFIKAIQAWGCTNIPEMAAFYTGNAGTIVMTAIFVVTIIVYQLVLNLQDGQANDMASYRVEERLLKIPLINRLVVAEINNHYTKHERINDKLKMTGDHTGARKFLLRRVLIGLVCVLAVNVLIFTANERSKRNLLQEFSQEFNSSIVPNENMREQMRQIAKDCEASYLEMPTPKPSQEEYARLVASSTGISLEFAKEIATEVQERALQYEKIYYKWYYIFICVAAYLAGYYTPYLILLYRLSIVQMDMEDEILQYQTVALILMYVDGIMIDTVLEWMERFSQIFREPIQECIISLEYSTQAALQRMKNRETFPPFRRFVDNLLMVDDEDIPTAFAEIETDREYYKEKRKEDNLQIVEKRAEIGKNIAFIPLFVEIFGYLIIPFAFYSLKAISNLSGL